MPLTDVGIKKTKVREKPFKLSDSRGLFLLVTPAGGKLWRLKYRIAGREKLLALGGYPDVSLSLAREKRDEARRLLASGVDPMEHQKAQRAATRSGAGNSFEVIAREWGEKQVGGKIGASHWSRILQRLEKEVFPWLGARPVGEVTAQELLSVIRRIEERTTYTAKRVLQEVGRIFRYAVSTGRATSDPAWSLRESLGASSPVDHRPAVVEPGRFGEVLRMIDTYPGGVIVRSALRLLPMLFVRPGELREALWEEIDLDAGEWRYFVTKTKTPHIVPLPHQALEILRGIYPLSGHTGEGFVFPGSRTATRPMSNGAIQAALRYLGLPKEEVSGHGFRATARTLLDEKLGFRVEWIEAQLAHSVKDQNGRAYNRTTFLEERRAMMQRWADYLDELKDRAGEACQTGAGAKRRGAGRAKEA